MDALIAAFGPADELKVYQRFDNLTGLFLGIAYENNLGRPFRVVVHEDGEIQPAVQKTGVSIVPALANLDRTLTEQQSMSIGPIE